MIYALRALGFQEQQQAGVCPEESFVDSAYQVAISYPCLMTVGVAQIFFQQSLALEVITVQAVPLRLGYCV